MSSSIYNSLFRGNQKIFALLIDPENQNEEKLIRILEMAATSKVDMILVGGSLTSQPVDEVIITVKRYASCPVVLFPGNLLQLTGKADGILLLSLLSGKKPGIPDRQSCAGIQVFETLGN